MQFLFFVFSLEFNRLYNVLETSVNYVYNSRFQLTSFFCQHSVYRQ